MSSKLSSGGDCCTHTVTTAVATYRMSGQDGFVNIPPQVGKELMRYLSQKTYWKLIVGGRGRVIFLSVVIIVTLPVIQ